jgi:hypothetical protein
MRCRRFTAARAAWRGGRTPSSHPSTNIFRVRVVPHRPLVFVFGLTVGDYLLWNWSLGANDDVLALVAGLTLPPLAVACVWLLVLNATRLIGYLAWLRRAGAPGAGPRMGRRRRAKLTLVRAPMRRRRADAALGSEPLSTSMVDGERSQRERDSRKLAA